MNFQEWLNSRNGQAVDVDGNWGPQCWDLWSDYAMTLFGASMYQTSTNSGGVYHQPGYACEIWHNFGGNLNWAFTPVGADQPAQYGDVAIWEYGSAVGPQSHVALVVSDNGGSIYCLTQNPGAAHYDNLSKSGLLGYLRPDNQSIIGGSGSPASGNATPSGSISDLADAVLRGEYGNGPSREAALGSLYNEVQAEVNRRLNGTPATPEAPSNASTPDEYVVQSGDSFWAIAERFFPNEDTNTKMYELLALNDNTRLYAGMTIRLRPVAVDNSAAEAAAKAAAEAEAAVKAKAEADAAAVKAAEDVKLAEASAKAAETAKEKALKETAAAAVELAKQAEALKKQEAAKANGLQTVLETVNNTIENITDGVNTMITTKYHGPVLTAEQYATIQNEVSAADNAGIDEVKNYNLISKEFWNYAGERVIKTFAMATAGQLSVTAAYVVTSPDSALVFADLGWTYIVSVAGVSALTSLLTALANFKDIVTIKKDNNL